MYHPPPVSEESWSQLFVNQINVATFCVGADARFLYANPVACQLLGYFQQELMAKTLQDVDLDFSEWVQRWRSLKQKGSVTFESRYRTKQGNVLPVRVTLTYVKNQEQEFGCAMVHELGKEMLPSIQADPAQFDGNMSVSQLYQEIAQLKQTEAQLEESLSLVRGTLDSAAYGIIAVSFEGEVLNTNQKFREMWQIPNTMVLAKEQECQEFFKNKLKNPDAFCRSVWEVSRESEEETYDILQLKDGRIFAQYSKPQYLSKQVIGRVWSIWDITEFKQRTDEDLQRTEAAEKLERNIEEAKQFSELKSRFLSMLCHQFRSSLNVISFSNSLLKRYVNRWTGEKDLAYLDNIQTAVEQISQLLDEMVFFGRSEVGHLKLEPESTDLDLFCCNLVAQMQPIGDSKKQTISFSSRGSCTVCVDTTILAHVLTNLLSNALKYSPNDKQIDFELACEEQIIFRIKDTGIGISTVDQKRLYEPFYRGSNIDHIPGNGLGLAIVKNLVEIHGGQIEVDSELGVGTTFTVTLPLNQPAFPLV